VHLQNTAHTLLLVLHAVENGGTGSQVTGVHTEEAQTAHIGVGHDLEGQSGEGLIIAGMTVLFLIGLGVGALDGGHVVGSGHIVHDGIQQLLNALVTVGSTADNGDHLVLNGGHTDSLADTLLVDLLALQIVLHNGVIEHGDGVQQLLAILVGQIHHIGGDLLHAHILAHLIIVDVSVHLHQVDDALEGILGADGELDGHGVALETVVDHVQNVVEVRAHDVHLVDVDHAGDLVLVCLTPNGLRLRLHAALGAQNGHRAVQHAQGTLDLNGEVHVARSIDDVDTGGRELILGTLPEAGGSSGGDGDTALLLLCHPVHGGGTVMGLTDLVVHAGVVQNTLGRGGLTGIDVRHDTDITDVFKRCFSWHTILLLALPTEVRERLVGLSLLVHLFTLLDRRAGVVGGIHQFTGQTLGHGALAAGAGIGRQPAQGQGLTTGGTNLHGHLIVGAADTASLDLQAGHDVLQRLLENLNGVLLRLFLDLVEGSVNNLLSYALLAVQHHTVDQLGHQNAAVHRIGQNFSLGNITSSGHFASLLLIE
jgi:hypothetical protein